MNKKQLFKDVYESMEDNGWDFDGFGFESRSKIVILKKAIKLHKEDIEAEIKTITNYLSYAYPLTKDHLDYFVACHIVNRIFDVFLSKGEDIVFSEKDIENIKYVENNYYERIVSLEQWFGDDLCDYKSEDFQKAIVFGFGEQEYETDKRIIPQSDGNNVLGFITDLFTAILEVYK